MNVSNIRTINQTPDPMVLYKLDFVKKLKKIVFPGVLLLLIIISAVDVYITKYLNEDYFGLLGMITGGGFITWNTLNVVIKKKKITAGVLVVLALIGSAYVGEYLAGAIVTFMMIGGEFLEELTLDKTRNAVRELIKLVPDTARIKANSIDKVIPISQVDINDITVVKPGERIPVDGKILKGQAAVNEASLTGESMPVDKTVGDNVFAGTLNENGVFEILTAKLGMDTMLGKIISVVLEAQDNKGDSQRLADKFASFFTPVILGIVVIVWFFFAGLPLDERLLRIMTILVIACPCALVLATPTAVVATVGNAAKHGALIKGGGALENTSNITTVCFDKTGTITKGKPEVVDIITFDGSSVQDLLNYAAIAEKNSGHPLGDAILKKAGRESIGQIADSEDFKLNFGKGVEVVYKGDKIEIANAGYFGEAEEDAGEKITEYISDQEKKGNTSLLVIKNDRIIGGIAIADTVRDEAKEIITELKELGIKRIIMLTGDNEITGLAIAEKVGIMEVKANLLPEDKLTVIKKLKAEGEIVAMIGDGINDAPALMISDVGISMGIVGTDVAVESSDISLMADDLKLIPQLLRASKVTMRIVKQNIMVFAVFVNVIGIWLSTIGFLTPVMAALVHNLSSVFVVANSARLLKYRYNV